MAERSIERLRAHWEIERELADRLRAGTPEERSKLYGEVYDELFRRVPDHPQVVDKADPAQRRAAVTSQQRLLERFLAAGETMLEVGAGDCAVSLAMTARARRVYAVEVSAEIAARLPAPDNFELLITDGREIPVPAGSVDLVYSNQLMEHLHPDDAVAQLQNIYAALRSGGRYVCLTPNRLLGPSDISQYFEDEVASGFHLREYSARELRDTCRAAGFADVRMLATLAGRPATLPLAPFVLGERLFESLPVRIRRRLKRMRLVRKAVHPGGGLVAVKG